MKRAIRAAFFATILCTASIASPAVSTAATSYKLVKGKLVYKSTGKVVPGKKIYKKKQYIHGIYVKDRVKPVIQLSAKKTTYTYEYGEKVKLPTAKAIDQVKGTWKVSPVIYHPNGKKIKKINATVPGKYTVVYTAVDYEKNKAVKKIYIVIEEETFHLIDIS